MHTETVQTPDFHDRNHKVNCMMIAVKKAVIERLLKDPEWSKKILDVRTNKGWIRLLKEFCHAKGLKVTTVQLKGKRG